MFREEIEVMQEKTTATTGMVPNRWFLINIGKPVSFTITVPIHTSLLTIEQEPASHSTWLVGKAGFTLV
jgi:hypothetical protein